MASSDVEIKLGLDTSDAESDAKSAGKAIGDKAGDGIEEGLDSGSKSGAKKAESNIDSGGLKAAGKSAGESAGEGIANGIEDGAKTGADGAESAIGKISSSVKSIFDKIKSYAKSAGDKAGKAIGDGIEEGTKDGVSDAEEAVEGLGSGIETALGALGIGAGVAGIFELVQSSAESSFSKIESTAKYAGTAVEDATKAYEDFIGITGDSDQAVEAANNAIRMCGDNTEELAQWTNIAAGAYSIMGDTIPIENLTEGALETQNTATVTGALADALNFVTFSTEQWSTMLGDHAEAQQAFNEALESGMTVEDAFNEALASCNDEQERGQLITDTLSNIYSEAGDEYLNVNDNTVKFNKSQDELNRTLQETGETYMPIVTDALQWFVDNSETVIPVITALAGALAAFSIISTIASGITAIQGALEVVMPLISSFFSILVANPISIVVIALTALTAALVYFFTQTETGRQIWSDFTTFLGNTAQNISTAFTNAGDWIQQRWTELQSFFGSLPEKITGFFSSLPGTIGSIFDDIKTGIQQKFNEVVSFVQSIPGKIAGAFSGAGSMLFNAGANIINGLLNGLKSAWGNVTSFVSGIGDWIVSHKGPPAYDKIMLVQNGQYIMDGLLKGMQTGYAKVRSFVGGLNVDIEGRAYAGARYIGSGQSRSTTVTNVTYYIGDTNVTDTRAGEFAEKFVALMDDYGRLART